MGAEYVMMSSETLGNTIIVCCIYCMVSSVGSVLVIESNSACCVDEAWAPSSHF